MNICDLCQQADKPVFMNGRYFVLVMDLCFTEHFWPWSL